jgi:hypothetical protein
MTIRLLPAAALLCAGLSGCAQTTNYPSLAPRPIEREVLRAEAVPPASAPAVAAPIPPSADVAAIIARAQAADVLFREALEKARPAIEAGRAAPEGSDAWVSGQQAYSSVDAAATPVADALGELDRRREDAATAGDAATEAAITDALVQLQALYEAQRSALAALMPA